MEPPPVVQPLFAGNFRHTMDAKNRVTIPARWRRGEADEFFAIADVDNGCLMVLPPEVMRRVAERVEQDPRFTTPQERRKFIRHFYSRAQHVVADKAGRMVIPDNSGRAMQ